MQQRRIENAPNRPHSQRNKVRIQRYCLQRHRQSHSARRHSLQMLLMRQPAQLPIMPDRQHRMFWLVQRMLIVRQSLHRQRRSRPVRLKPPLIRHRKRRRKRESRHSLLREVPKVQLRLHKQRVSMPAMQPHLKPQRVKAPSRPRRLQNRVITARQLQR